MAKRKKNSLPKRIGGVKIPRSLRQGVLAEMLTSPAGQAIIAAVIMKMAARLAHQGAGPAHAVADGSVRFAAAGLQRAGDGMAHAGSEAAEAAGAAAGAARDVSLNFKHALAEAARHFILGLSHPKPPVKKSRKAQTADVAEDGPAARSRRAEDDERASHH